MAKYRISLTVSADVDASDREEARAALDRTVEGTAHNWSVALGPLLEKVKAEKRVEQLSDCCNAVIVS